MMIQTPSRVMELTVDGTVNFYDLSGDLFLTFSGDGMTDGTDTVDIGEAAKRFVGWVRDTCPPSAKDAEIERLNSGKWISVDDLWPLPEQKVLYYFEHTGVSAGKYWGDGTFGGPSGFLHDDVTHWQPLPEPPAGGDK